jgi:probable F420-dependent oxidoreductase
MDAPKRPFRFGVAANGFGTRVEWLEFSRKAEAFGYSSLLVGDHFCWELGPFVALTAAAESTTTLRLGGYVFNNDLRHPAVLAKEVATLDVMTGGRVELGMGAGWYEPEYAQAGLTFDEPRVRIARLGEAIRIVKGLFGPDPVTFAGRHYTVSGIVGLPKPVQCPHPPLLIGGSGRAILSLAAREADVVGLVPRLRESRVDLADASPAAMERRLAWVRQEAGERFGAIEIGTLLFDFQVTDDRTGYAAQAATRWAGHDQSVEVPAELYLDSVSVLVGSVDHIVEQLHGWRERLGISYVVVWPQEQLEAFAPVVARLAAT